MDLSQWLITSQAISESELVLQSLNLNVNSILFTSYLLVSVLIKRAVFIAAFFSSCLLFDAAIFDLLSESQLYAITFAIYSYVIFCNSLTLLTKSACVIILVICVLLGYDAYFYGIGGVYGARETFVYNNIQYLALYSHIILISTLVPYRRIKDGFRRFIDYVMYMPSHSVNFILL